MLFGKGLKEYDFRFFSPPGVFEFASFANGTKAVMDAVVSATKTGATTIIGMNVVVSVFYFLQHHLLF